jgi:arylsulfatase A-like enzyme
LRGIPVLLLSLAFLAAGGCSLGSSERELHGAVLIVLDTLRADGLSSYGNGRRTSPHLDALAEKGVLFERAVSHASGTLPAFVGLLSGRYPSAEVMDGELLSSMVEQLRDAGFRTAAFTEGGYVSSFYGIDLGFGEFLEEEGAVHLTIGGRAMHGRAGGIEETFRRAEAWLRENGSAAFFLMVHTYEVHTPYRRLDFATGLERGRLPESFEIGKVAEALSDRQPPSDAELAYVRALYDGGVAAADRHVRGLLDVLKELGLAEETLVVLTSDHGEDLGDRAPPRPGTHGHSLYDELLLVPLVIYDPRLEGAVSRVRAQVRLVDVLPTILDLLGVPEDPRSNGRSLAPLMRGEETEDRPAYAQIVTINGGARKVALREGSYKLIQNAFPKVPAVELYDLAADPAEARNLASEEKELREQLQEKLRRARAPVAEGGLPNYRPGKPTPRALKEQLEALGYVE